MGHADPQATGCVRCSGRVAHPAMPSPAIQRKPTDLSVMTSYQASASLWHARCGQEVDRASPARPSDPVRARRPAQAELASCSKHEGSATRRGLHQMLPGEDVDSATHRADCQPGHDRADLHRHERGTGDDRDGDDASALVGWLAADGLHMTGRRCIGSVKHATHLFLEVVVGTVVVAGRPGGCETSRPGPGSCWLGLTQPGPGTASHVPRNNAVLPP